MTWPIAFTIVGVAFALALVLVGAAWAGRK